MSERQRTIERLKAQLEEWDVDIQRLAEKAGRETGKVKARYQEELDELRQRRQEAHERMEALHDAANDAWDEVVKGAEQAWSRLRDALRRARDEDR